jgi:hypothetical protein
VEREAVLPPLNLADVASTVPTLRHVMVAMNALVPPHESEAAA